uniref:Uncharacterized protein n=1 Tax=Zea mays TaxID=4577 RepID=C0PBA1_MAIZE|nr:unknown [Zea mays]
MAYPSCVVAMRTVFVIQPHGPVDLN